jgi:tetratricopeptide (TPR) repeat protein
MKSPDKHIHLFDPSGCINESAFFGYLNHELNSLDMNAIEGHLSECLLCSDAMDGYEQQVDKAKIQKNLLALKNEFLLKHNKQKKDNKRYLIFAVSIAASFVLIISGYYLFQILPMNSKQQELALISPVHKNDIPEVQNSLGPKSENVQEEKSGSKYIIADRSMDKGDINAVSQSELQQKSDKVTKSEREFKFYDNRDGWFETDGDGVTTTKATGKSAEEKSVMNAGTSVSLGLSRENGLVVTEDAEQSGKISDVTIAIDQKDELKKESVPIETTTIVDKVLSDNSLRGEEKVVSGKKNRSVLNEENEKQPVAAAGGVMRSVLTPSLNSAMALYNTENYEEALPQFEYLVEHEKSNYAAMYYLAMCQYYKGEKDSALIHLDKLVKKKNNPFYELGMWQKAQIVEESNDKKQALDIYKEIIKNNGSMKSKAGQKVDELEK